MQCLLCPNPALYGENLILDWGQDSGRVDAYQVTACQRCLPNVREKVVSIFNRHRHLGPNERNALVAGSVVNVIPGSSGHVHTVVIWSDFKLKRNWRLAQMIEQRLLEDEDGYQALFGNPLHVHLCDWRGWHREPANIVYALPDLGVVQFGLPWIVAFIKTWVAGLPTDWQPTIQHRLPPFQPEKIPRPVKQ